MICCDNAGENKTLEESCAKSFEEIKFEFMSPGTPQKNGVVGQGFDTAYYRMRAIMAHTVIHGKLSTELWFECVATKKNLKIMVNPYEKNVHMRSSMEKYQTTQNT